MNMCSYSGDYKSSKMTNVINVMVTQVFSQGNIPACDPSSANIGYIGGDPTGDETYKLGPAQSSTYSLGLTLFVVVLILIPCYLCVIPCTPGFRNPDKPYDLDKIFEEDDAPASGGGGHAAIQNNSNVSIERQANEGKVGGIAGVLKEMSTPYHDHTFGEAFIHQLIETIEFVLGTVSNTASYLRLWALSLAHGQLSEVFFNLIVSNYISIFRGLPVGGSLAGTGAGPGVMTCVYCFILWPVFWSVTFAVIMCMDQMECFLHCLRLHWVEMQNKFYKGDGYEYQPLKTQTVLEQAKSE